ncbi:nucleosome assembly protein 1;4-like protein isoform X2, partial [Tanacetum coccineum]
MKNNEITAEERDEEALKYLKDIKWCHMDDPKGFKLEFFFETYPFFTNSVLTKVYHMIDDDETILEKAIGSTIRDKIILHAFSWFSGEANEGDFGVFDDEVNEDDEDDDEIEEDEEEDDEETKTKTKKKSKLKSIGGTDSVVLENMKPVVRKRVEVLRDIQ